MGTYLFTLGLLLSPLVLCSCLEQPKNEEIVSPMVIPSQPNTVNSHRGQRGGENKSHTGQKEIVPVVISSQPNNTNLHQGQINGENESRTRKGDERNVNQELVEICEQVDRAVRNFLGCEIISVLAKPDRVESFKVNPKWNPKKRNNTLSGFPIVKQGNDLSGELLKNFQTLVFDQNSYLLGTEKRCFFRPKVGLHFIKDKSEVNILLSFSCDIWLVFYGENKK
ncbi:hypothetical protein, partial [Candidatus Parabeggiatoa sp. HSG14]|uniref:hypothetical protein n=1 Tax=Candidatus Parabeggiatoa sp. HSG14 TaxID=3055593 RepID=UPI0025A7876D|nr:hypothetical protein [Thiotrichales bacterium HSG14]